MPHSDFVMHYASPYYDPVKAHEYYEAHKQLKGRHSTKGFTDSGREAANYVKKNLKNKRDIEILKSKVRRDTNIKRSSNTTKGTIESLRERAKSEKESYRNQTQSKIDRLREDLKSLSSEDKKGPAGEAIRNKVASLRASNAQRREQISAALKDTSEKLRTSHKETATSEREIHKQNVERINKDYDDNLEREYEKIRGDSKMYKAPKQKKKKK